jgi:SAM-dependent methyltransferase
MQICYPFCHMTVKEHYDYHLGNFYSWMAGPFDDRVEEQRTILKNFDLQPGESTNIAIDLGCGHGIHSVALASLGFHVQSVDFNRQLLSELQLRRKNYPIQIIEADIIDFLGGFLGKAGVVCCMGDTLTHLRSINEVDDLIKKSFEALDAQGKIILSFRDLKTSELRNENRFIPVKSDDNRILTCFLEFFDDHVMIHDILHERSQHGWDQKVSSYPKIRISIDDLTNLLTKNHFSSITKEEVRGMTYISGSKTIQ